MNNKFWNSPAWSMGQRSSSNNKKVALTNPGPGNYNLAGNSTSKGGKFGTSNRDQKGKGGEPGPGNYNVNSKSGAPHISMGKKYDSTFSGGFLSSPGPGQYNIAGDSNGKGVTLGSKYHSNNINQQEPGPGAYNIKNNYNSGIKIGSSQRIGFGTKNKIPGPGAYTYDKRPYSAGPKYGFGRSQRSETEPKFRVGPGSYDIKSSINEYEKGATMGERFNKKGNNLSNPGPGDYDIASKRPATGAKIGNAKRGGFDKACTPGPGSYGNDQNNKNLHGTKIGTGKRGDFGSSLNPGPGAYDLSKDIHGGVTISGYKGKSKISENPGPGAYDPSDYGSKVRPGSAHIGKSQRSGFKKAETPGPGQYYHDENSNYKFAYMKEPRSKEMKNRDPGPGQYDIPPSVPNAPHYLIDPSIYLAGGSKS